MNQNQYRQLESKITNLEAKIYSVKKLKERSQLVAGALLSDEEDPTAKISYGGVSKKRSSFATNSLRTYIKGDKIVLENYSTTALQLVSGS